MVRRGSALSMWLPAMGISLFGVCFVAAGARRKNRAAVTLLGSILTAVFLLPSCGGSNGPGACTAAPNAPTGLTASSTTGTGTMLSWAAPTSVGSGSCGSISYSIYQGGAKIGASTREQLQGYRSISLHDLHVCGRGQRQCGNGSPKLTLKCHHGLRRYACRKLSITITGTDASSLSSSAQVTLTVN